jgi:hypothetical protein
MKQTPFLLFALAFLVFGAGCTDPAETGMPENVTPTPAVLHYERGDVAIPINASELPVRGFDVNVTEVIAIVLTDRRAEVLLENGWNITSVRTGFGMYSVDPARTYVDVEFRSDEESPSFFIEVDEGEKQTGKGRCNVPFWWDGRGPYPEDYHQNQNMSTNQYYVFDHRNERVTMVYNETAIIYLYPSYGVE